MTDGARGNTVNIKRGWAVAAILLFMSSMTSWFLYAQSASVSDLLKPSAIRTGLQNFSLGHDSEKDILLMGTYKNVLIAYDRNEKELWRFEGKGPFRALKVDSVARRVYAGNEDNNLYILNLDTGEKISSIDVERRIYNADVSADGTLIAISAGVSSNKHNLMLYDASGKQLASVKIGSTAKAIAISGDQRSILLGTNRAELIQFDFTGKELSRRKLSYEIVSLQVLPKQKEILAGTKDASYVILDDRMNVIGKGKADGEGMSLGAGRDGSYIGIGTKSGFFTIFDHNGKSVYNKKLEYSVTGILFTGHKAYVTGLGDFLYELDENKLLTIVRMNAYQNVFKGLACSLPFLFLICLIMAIPTLRTRTTLFFRTLYRYRTAYLLLTPTILLLLLFCYYPAFIAFTRAFTDWSRQQSSITDIRFVGLDNFKTMISEGYFFTGLKNLGIILITSFLKVMTVPLIVAKLVFSMQSGRAKYWFRFLFVVPMVVPGVVAALMWVQIYDPSIGLINQALHACGLDTWQRVWLGDERTAIWAIVFMGFPFIDAFAFLVYYGGLINIPSSLFEAARVDGSNPVMDFTRIQLPLITPQIKLLIVLTFIGAIQNFTGVLLLTSGGPGSSTYVPGLELYYNATRFGRFGYACALGVVMFVAILIGTIINMRMKADEAME